MGVIHPNDAPPAQDHGRHRLRLDDSGIAVSRFRYLRDPLCLGACFAYALNRWWLKPSLDWPFLHNHFNDVLTLPAGLPVVLWFQRKLQLRHSDGPPDASETVLHLAVWSILCEYVGPTWLGRGTADPWDAVAYSIGGIGAWWVWNRRLPRFRKLRA